MRLGLLAFCLFAVVLFPGRLSAVEPTTIKVTDEVLVEDTERLGVHFSGDNFYDSVILKQRVAESFEGTVRRRHVMGPNDQPDPRGIYLWSKGLEESWVGATAHVLGGPDQWKQAKVTAVETRVFDYGGNREPTETSFVRFDQPVRWTQEGHVAGVLLEKSDLEAGQHPWLVERRKEVDGDRVQVREYDIQYCSPERTEVVTGDVPEQTVGVAALKLDGTGGEAFVKFRVQFYQAAPYDGTWTVDFWAKAVGGSPQLTVRPTVPGTPLDIPLSGEWRHYTEKMELARPEDPDRNPIFMLQFEVSGGQVLLDQIEAGKDNDGTNPTPFRDELVDVFRFLRPGSVRYLRNTRDTVRNWIQPRIRNASRRGLNKRRDDFGTHEFYEFCRYIGASPWANLPGTLLPQDIDDFMEYCGAPAETGLGRLRAKLGREEPWTRAFEKIYVQFGNEAITFGGTGYWGPDYWQTLIERAKGSPYYDPDIFVFVVNHQGGGTRLMDMHPGFDRFTISGYHIFGLYQDQIERAGDLPGFYDWVFGSAWHMWMSPKHNRNYGYLTGARQRDMEICIYEGGNYHTTFSTPEEVPLERINRMIVGRAGGMSATHSMLLLLKHWGARTQQSFNLSQFSFSPGGAFGNIPGRVRLWGGVLRIGNPEERRYRPRFLALRIANQVIGGDLVQTVHSGADPKFSVNNRFGAGYGPSRNPEEMTVEDIPRIHSYAFRDGRRRGLILVSNDPREAQPVVLELPGEVEGATAGLWRLHSEALEDSNEHDWAPEGPQVTVQTETLENFRSGHTLSLPPATMLAIEWQQE